METNNEFLEFSNSKILEGCNLIAKAVGITFGPQGQSAILYRGPKRVPHITFDGITVGKQVVSSDPVVQMAIDLVSSASEKVEELAGDGTTSAILLINAFVKYITEALGDFKGNKRLLFENLELEIDSVVKSLKSLAITSPTRKNLTEIGLVATKGNKSITETSLKAVEKCGENGIIKVEFKKDAAETYIDHSENIRLNWGFFANQFALNNETMMADLDNPMIMLSRDPMEDVDLVLPILKYSKQSNRPLVIFTTDLNEECMKFIVQNLDLQDISVVQISESSGNTMELLADLSIVTGAKVLSKANGVPLKSYSPEQYMGSVKNIKIQEYRSELTPHAERKPDIKKRANELDAYADTVINSYKRTFLKDRVAMLRSSTSTIYVGGKINGASFTEISDTYDDCIRAIKSATIQGIVPGGGNALAFIAYLRRKKLSVSEENSFSEKSIAAQIITKSISTLRQILLTNAGIRDDNSEILLGEDYDLFGTGEKIQYLEAGILDSVHVIEAVVQNAFQIAKLITNSRLCIHTVLPRQEYLNN